MRFNYKNCVIPLINFFILSLLSGCIEQLPSPVNNGRNSTVSSRTEVNLPKKEKITVVNPPSNLANRANLFEQQNPNNQLSDSDLEKQISGHEKQHREENIEHEVLEGETVESIADKYHISADELIEVNKLNQKEPLEELQILRIPNKGLSIEEKQDSEIANNIDAQKGKQTSAINSKFIWPVKGKVISRFGDVINGRKNNGINIAASAGSPVYAVSDGIIAYADYDQHFGNLIIIKIPESNTFIAYAHLDSFVSYEKGYQIKAGQIIGYVGNSGSVTEHQLHFAIRKGAEAVDPLNYLMPVQ